MSWPEGNSSCSHPPLYLIVDPDSFVCGLCYIRDAVSDELPKKLHFSKQLTTNGNPQQTPLLIAHVQLIEGLKPPRPHQPLKDFRLARAKYTAPAYQIFPFTSALWDLMGYQPKLATPLIRAIAGEGEPQIANGLGLSRYETIVRIAKGIRATLTFLRT